MEGEQKVPTCNRLLISSSIMAIVLASATAGLFAPAAALAQTIGSEKPSVAKVAKSKKEQAQASPVGGAQDSPDNNVGDMAGDQPAVPEAVTGADIVVTGQRRALESAAEMKRNSDTITDSIVLDEANKVPSTSLMEVLERVPGITINRIRSGAEGSPDGFTFEGSGIQVRGLSGTKTLVNGLEVFSANGGAGLSYTDIGPELLKAVTVYKASRADLIEGGVAGTVDLQTYMPFDFRGPKVAASVSGSYGDFSETVMPSLSMMASTRFNTGIGEFGVLADLAVSKIKSYDSNFLVQPYYPTEHNGDTAYAPGGFSATDDQFERTRKGFYGAVQWRPTPGLEFYHTTFISEWNSNRNTQLMILSQPAIGVTDDSVFDDGVFVNGGITNATAPGTGIIVASNSSFTPSYSRTSDFSQGFKYSSDRFHVSGSYQYVSARSGSSKYGMGMNGGSAIQTNIDTRGSIPDISFQDPVEPDPTVTVASNFAWLTQTNKGHANAWQLDANYDLGEGFFRKVAVGGRIANRTETDNFVGTWWSASAKGYNGVTKVSVAGAPPGDMRLEQFQDFFKGDVQTPASVYVASPNILNGNRFDYVMNTYAACAPDLYFQCPDPTKTIYLYGNPPDPTFGLQPSFSTTKPTTKSAYAMVGFKHDSDSPFLNFSGNLGVRWVSYDVKSEGNYVFTGDTTFYQNLSDAQASVAQMGGINNVAAWEAAHPGENPPLSLTSNSYSANRAGSFSKNYFMPSFNIEFKPTNSLVLRYALTKTLTPPSYSDIRAQGTASVSTILNPLASGSTDAGLPGIFNGYTYTSGVPSLKPETSLNNDISIEWYPHRGTTLHLSLFDKTIKNQFLYNSISGTASSFFSQGDLPQSTPADGSAPIFVDGSIIGKGDINASKNTFIKGAELGGQTYFTMLPGFLKGFGVDANVTYIDGHSPSAFALDMTGNPENVPLIGLSKWSYAATLLYDLHKVTARLSWTWRSRYLVTSYDSSTSNTYMDPVSGETVNFALPVYASAAGRLSGSIGYQFSKRLNVQLDVENITNAYQKTEMEILPGRYVQRGVFETDRRVSLHLGFNF